jgi:hypothetical protein
MKRFTDNYEPIEIELMDKAGNITALKSQFMTQKDWAEIGELKTDGSSTQNCKTMAKVYGGKPEDYLKYSTDILVDAIKYYNEQLGKNPQKAQGS